jgi:hypothetical protein
MFVQTVNKYFIRYGMQKYVNEEDSGNITKWPKFMEEVEEFPKIYEIEDFMKAFDEYSKAVQSTVGMLLSGGRGSEVEGWEPYDDMEKITNNRNFSKMALYHIGLNSVSGDYADWQKNRDLLHDCLRQIHLRYFGEHHISEIYYLIKIAYIVEAIPELDHDIGLDKQMNTFPLIFYILMNYFTGEGKNEFPSVKNHVMKILSWCIFDEDDIRSHRGALKQFSLENADPNSTHSMKIRDEYFKDLYNYFENVKPMKI